MVEIIKRRRANHVPNKPLRQLVGAVLEAVGCPGAELNVVFVGDRAMRRLNREFRGIDKPTDVLSFPYSDLPSPYESTKGERRAYVAARESLFLGEIVISTETAVRYAEELNLTFPTEIKYLTLHGILHLCGWDHETDKGQMTRLERRLRKEILGEKTDW